MLAAGPTPHSATSGSGRPPSVDVLVRCHARRASTVAHAVRHVASADLCLQEVRSAGRNRWRCRFVGPSDRRCGEEVSALLARLVLSGIPVMAVRT